VNISVQFSHGSVATRLGYDMVKSIMITL